MSRPLLVAVKRVIDYTARVRVLADKVRARGDARGRQGWRRAPRRLLQSHRPPLAPSQSGVDLANVKMSMNPFCEIAVEVRPRRRGGGGRRHCPAAT